MIFSEYIVAPHISTCRVLNQMPDLGIRYMCIRYMWLSWLGWDGLNHLPGFDVSAWRQATLMRRLSTRARPRNECGRRRSRGTGTVAGKPEQPSSTAAPPITESRTGLMLA